MLDRSQRDSPTPGAIRARASRERQRQGIGTFKVRTHRRRLVAAMQRANVDAGDLATVAEVEAELQAVVDAWIERWIGKKPCA